MITLSVLLFALNSNATLTKEEQKTVAEADKVAQEAAKRPAPSKQMQDKMQSTFSDVPKDVKPTGSPTPKPAHPNPAKKVRK